MWPGALYNLFSHFTNGKIFGGGGGGGVLRTKNVFSYPLRLTETFPILRRKEGEIMFLKMFIGVQVKYPSFSTILMKLEFSRQIFEKSSNITFHENPSNGSRAVPCGRTNIAMDRLDEADGRFSQFCERS
jgi:hypothetical protein